MAVVKSWRGLTGKIQEEAQKCLKDGVFEALRDVYQKHIQEDVYDAYSPNAYQRRDISGGLIADQSIVGELAGNTLEVRNIAAPNVSIASPPTKYTPPYDTQFMTWVERGQAYNGKAKALFARNMSGEPWAKPRPATQNAIDDIRRNKQHITALKNGLQGKGIKTK